MLKSYITPPLLINILSKNFGMKRLDGHENIAEMGARQAFNFVQTVNGLSGCSYFLTEDFEPMNWPGKPLIDATPSMETATILDYYQQFPHLFKGTKYLLALTKNKSSEESKIKWQQHLQETIRQVGLNPRECIVCEIFVSYKGGALEAFTEYVAARLLIRDGFFVENGVHLEKLGLQNLGIPDLFAYRTPRLVKSLRSMGFPSAGFLHELALFNAFGSSSTAEMLEEISSLEEPQERCFIVAEAKTGTTSQKTLYDKYYKYNEGGLFHSFLQITPSFPKVNDEWDYIDFKEDGRVDYIRGICQSENESNHPYWPEYLQSIEEKWSIMEAIIINRAKFYLLQNIELRKQFELLGAKSRTWGEFHQTVADMDIEQVLGWIQKDELGHNNLAFCD